MNPNTQNETVSSQINEGFIDKIEVARRLKKTPRTIEVWAKRGIIPHLKIGRSVLYNWPDVLVHLNANFTIRASRTE
jgi:hypothetical protein